MASFPTTVKSFANRSAGQTIAAAHINDLQDEVAAMEGGLRSGTAPLNSSNSTFVALSVSGGSTLTGALTLGGGIASTVSFASSVTFLGNVTVSGTLTASVGSSALVSGATTGLSVDTSGYLTSATQPRCQAYNNTTQAISNNTWTALALNAEDYDVGAMHDNVTNNSRMTIPAGAGGLYLVTAKVTFPIGSTGQRSIVIRKNGTDVTTMVSSHYAIAQQALMVSALVVLAAADYVEGAVLQVEGGSVNAGSATRNLSNEVSIVRIW